MSSIICADVGKMMPNGTTTESRGRMLSVIETTRDARFITATRCLPCLFRLGLPPQKTYSTFWCRQSERVPVARDIVGEIRNGGGRFLARTKKGTLKDIDNELAIRWASLCIRRAVESSINDIENVGDV